MWIWGMVDIPPYGFFQPSKWLDMESQPTMYGDIMMYNGDV